VEVVASLSEGRTAAAQCGLFTHKSVPVIFEPPCIFAHSLYHAVLHIGHADIRGILSHRVAGTVCICCPSLCVLFLWRSTSCLTFGLVLPLFRSKFLLLSLFSIARGTCLLH